MDPTPHDGGQVPQEDLWPFKGGGLWGPKEQKASYVPQTLCGMTCNLDNRKVEITKRQY